MNSDQIVSLIEKGITGAGVLAITLGWSDAATIGPFETAAFSVVGGLAVLYGGARSIWKHTHAAQIAKGKQSQIAAIVAGGTSP